jgi:hypothetical protein
MQECCAGFLVFPTGIEPVTPRIAILPYFCGTKIDRNFVQFSARAGLKISHWKGHCPPIKNSPYYSPRADYFIWHRIYEPTGKILRHLFQLLPLTGDQKTTAFAAIVENEGPVSNGDRFWQVMQAALKSTRRVRRGNVILAINSEFSGLNTTDARMLAFNVIRVHNRQPPQQMPIHQCAFTRTVRSSDNPKLWLHNGRITEILPTLSTVSNSSRPSGHSRTKPSWYRSSQ